MKKGYDQETTWGDIYNTAVLRGIDHGYAAWLADEWEKRQEKQRGFLSKKTIKKSRAEFS